MGHGSVSRRKHRRNVGEAHVRLYRHELDCAAYRTLSPNARVLLIELRALYDVKRGDNRVFFGIRSMCEGCNFSSRAAMRARNELLERGWITIAEPGSFHRKVRHATVFTLENEAPSNAKGSVPSKAFMRWHPDERKNTVCNSTTERYANRLPSCEKKAVTVCNSTTEKPNFDPATVCESTTQITITKQRARAA